MLLNYETWAADFDIYYNWLLSRYPRPEFGNWCEYYDSIYITAQRLASVARLRRRVRIIGQRG